MSMTLETASAGVTELVVSALRKKGVPDRPGMDDVLKSAGLDSLGTVTLVLALEKRFSLVIPDGFITMGHFSTIRAISTMLVKLAEAPTTPAREADYA